MYKLLGIVLIPMWLLSVYMVILGFCAIDTFGWVIILIAEFVYLIPQMVILGVTILQLIAISQALTDEK